MKYTIRAATFLLFSFDIMKSTQSNYIQSPRILEGIRNATPGPGMSSTNDYIILGNNDTWSLSSQQPSSLTIENIGTRDVIKEEYQYFSRGWTLGSSEKESPQYTGSVLLSDGVVVVPVKIKVMSVC